MHVSPATLYVVATPIGNLGDMTYRAVAVLGAVDRILCEDTRKTGTLCEHFECRRPLVRFDANVEHDRLDDALAWLAAGEALALVSDAGTPALSDPGQRLVRAAWEAGYRVVPVPGASALTAAISASGLGAGGFTFGGFLPKASEARQKLFAALAPGVHAYFVPARDLAEVAGEMVGVQTISEVAIARELTKIHETFYRGVPAEVAPRLAANPESGLGEAVLVFEVTASATDDAAIARALRSALATGASARDAAHTVAEALGIPRRRAYQLALSLPKEA